MYEKDNESRRCSKIYFIEQKFLVYALSSISYLLHLCHTYENQLKIFFLAQLKDVWSYLLLFYFLMLQLSDFS